MELKPCPFCGSNKLRDMDNNIVCDNCCAEGPYQSEGHAEAWNTRTDDKELKALRAESAMCKRLLFEAWNNGLIEFYDLGDGTYQMAGDPGEGTFPITKAEYELLVALTNKAEKDDA